MYTYDQDIVERLESKIDLAVDFQASIENRGWILYIYNNDVTQVQRQNDCIYVSFHTNVRNYG